LIIDLAIVAVNVLNRGKIIV